MVSSPVVVQVRPNGDVWQVRIGESSHLTLQSKQTAIAEAHVQAMLSQPSRVVIHAADGSVEEQANYPANQGGDGVVAETGTPGVPSGEDA